MSYTLKKISDVHPEWLKALKEKCYGVNGACATVHKDMGPFLNEYMYQEALQIQLQEQGIAHQREYYFSVDYHGKRIQHKHFVDFLVEDSIIVECKAVDRLCTDHRQQLWNYMRLTGMQIGVLYNFGAVMAQSEHYYLDTDGTIYMF